MIKLRDHQASKIEETRHALRRNRSVIFRAPTGFGKTICAAYIVASAVEKLRSVIFTVHRRELIKQTMDTFDMCGIAYGVIAAGHRVDPMQNVQIASIDTLKRRLEVVPEPDLLIIDECHHAVSAGWASVLKHYDETHVLGLTATPWRLDGKGLGDLFGEIVHGCETRWLIDNKYLAPFRAFAPSSPDMAGVHTKMGDYDTVEIEELMDKPKITGDAVEHYKKICCGARAVAFATTVAHSQHIAECFNQQGIPALHIDGGMAHGERDEAIRRFRAGEIRVLSNCNIISEGFDVPAMDAAILLRPTKSLSLYLQQVGRALRYVDGKTAYILDHAGNIATHGLPTDEFDWSLNGRKKKPKGAVQEIKVKVCEKCFCTYEAKAPFCPNCGEAKAANQREIEQVAGQLAEIDQDNWRRTAPYKDVVAKADGDRAELLKIAKARGYKLGWVGKVLGETRHHARPNVTDILDGQVDIAWAEAIERSLK